MPKTTKQKREQLGVRVSVHALEVLTALQEHYRKQAGVLTFSQSDAVDKLLRETNVTLNLGIKEK